MIPKENSDPRFDDALIWAAGHFLSFYPPTFTGKQILDTLRSDEKLPRNLRLWESLKCDREELADHIELLARAFVRFANHDPLVG